MKNLLLLTLFFSYLSLSGQSGNNWMSNLPYGTKLSDLSIPGTHDSGATTGDFRIFNPPGTADFCNAQSASISTQLNYGVRFLDIRIGERSYPVPDPVWYNPFRTKTHRSYRVAHGVCFYGKSLQDVINDIKSFLTSNPNETVIMSLKVENADGSKAQRIKDHCRSVLVNNRYYTGSSGSKRLMNDLNGTTPVIHSLGWARGQIIVMDRSGFGPTGNKIGIEAGGWADNTSDDLAGAYLRIQDTYSGVSFPEKRRRIRAMRATAKSNHGTSSERITLNFASFTATPTPLSIVAAAINPTMESDYDNTTDRERCILIVDYVNRDLAEAIWKNNFNGSTYVPRTNVTPNTNITETSVSLPELAEQGNAAVGTTATPNSTTKTFASAELETIIAPNPTSGPFALMINNVQAEGNAQIMIHDMQGKVVVRKDVYLSTGTNSFRIEKATLSTGLYVVNVVTEQGMQKTVKLQYQ